MQLILASNNAKKLAELGALFQPLAIELLPQSALGIDEAEEPHHSFVENALAKARHAARASGLPAIADDSGLAVAALGGAPGVISAHYADLGTTAGEAANDAGAHFGDRQAAPMSDREALRARQDSANNRRLLAELAALPPGTSRSARFVCVLVAIRSADDPEPLIAIGRWEGEILAQLRGAGGFGYDPLMFIPALGQTVAELPAAIKNRHSHRALACAQMLELMRLAWQLG
ncbi:MAG: RdgB/HAM1 family non-canonical purine pyrophosphatase [Pseudomonadota bacterium]|jgi:XTP/dITP diphosphohydrolase